MGKKRADHGAEHTPKEEHKEEHKEEVVKHKKRGTRMEVWLGIADKTAGGLTKADLFEGRSGAIISKRASEASKGKIEKRMAKGDPFKKKEHHEHTKSPVVVSDSSEEEEVPIEPPKRRSTRSKVKA